MIKFLRKNLLARFDDQISVVSTSTDSIEAMSFGISKKSGLINLTKYLQIPLDEVMVFGDQQNDCGMIKIAGIGVAMGNAIEEIKTISDYVVGTNNEEGPADFLANILIFN